MFQEHLRREEAESVSRNASGKCKGGKERGVQTESMSGKCEREQKCFGDL